VLSYIILVQATSMGKRLTQEEIKDKNNVADGTKL